MAFGPQTSGKSQTWSPVLQGVSCCTQQVWTWRLPEPRFLLKAETNLPLQRTWKQDKNQCTHFAERPWHKACGLDVARSQRALTEDQISKGREIPPQETMTGRCRQSCQQYSYEGSALLRQGRSNLTIIFCILFVPKQVQRSRCKWLLSHTPVYFSQEILQQQQKKHLWSTAE